MDDSRSADAAVEHATERSHRGYPGLPIFIASARDAIHTRIGADRIRPIGSRKPALVVERSCGSPEGGPCVALPAQRRRQPPVPAVIVRNMLPGRGGQAREAARLAALHAASPRERARRAGRVGHGPRRSLAPCFHQPISARPSPTPGDHLHHAADRIGPIQRALRPRRIFDALDVAHVHQREIDAAAERVHAHAVDEHQGEVGLSTPREHRGERPASAAAAHRQAGNCAQRVAEALDLAVPELCRRDHGHAADHVLDRRLDLSRRDHDGLGHGADCQRHVDRANLVADERCRLRGAVQARRMGQQPIGARRQVGDIEPPLGVCIHGARAERADDGHARGNHGVTLRVGDQAADACRLCRKDDRGEHERGEQRRSEPTRDQRRSMGRLPDRQDSRVHGDSFRRAHAPGSPVWRSRKDGPGPGFLTRGSRRVALRLPMSCGAQ